VVLPARAGPGRPKEFCSQRCRQWDWVSRQRAHELRLSDDELVVARQQLDDLHDAMYVLECAVADTRRDIAEGLTAKEALHALHWLLEAAEPLVQRRLGPS
jgi:Lon protease-like protein